MVEQKQLGIIELIDTVEKEFCERRYSNRYTNDVKKVYYYLRKYATANNIDVYDQSVGAEFVKAQYHIESCETKRVEVKRALNMLYDYLNFGEVRLKTIKVVKYPEQLSVAIEEYLAEYQRLRNVSAKTIDISRRCLLQFARYLEENGIQDVSGILAININDFIKNVLYRYSPHVLAECLSLLRRFTHFAYEHGYHKQDLSIGIIRMKVSRLVNKIPRAFEKSEVERLLSFVDRGSPSGKRDYAILLLAAKLGMRAGDIEGLRFEHINWDTKTIRFYQHKTKNPLELPLFDDIGWAIIDYLQNGRPKIDNQVIFVRQVPPHIPLITLNHVVAKYLRLAKIPVPAGRLCGTHSLRHSLAKTLLECNVPIVVIRDILGHENVATTEIYTNVDISDLKQCALEVPNVEN